MDLARSKYRPFKIPAPPLYQRGARTTSFPQSNHETHCHLLTDKRLECQPFDYPVLLHPPSRLCRAFRELRGGTDKLRLSVAQQVHGYRVARTNPPWRAGKFVRATSYFSLVTRHCTSPDTTPLFVSSVSTRALVASRTPIRYTLEPS